MGPDRPTTLCDGPKSDMIVFRLHIIILHYNYSEKMQKHINQSIKITLYKT